MTTEYSFYVNPACDVSELRRYLFERVITSPPPFDVARWVMPFRVANGRPIRIQITHSSRNIHIIDEDITSHVLRTAIMGFQSHRLSNHTPFQANHRRPVWMQTHRATRRSNNMDTGQQCSICFENICSNDIATLACAHSFHRACIGRWVERTPSCPLCREPLQ